MRFVRCQTHPKCPDEIGWYVVLKPDDLDLLMQLHKGVVVSSFLRACKSEVVTLSNPVRVAAYWSQSIEKLLFTGKTVLVNLCGGFLLFEGIKILAEIECEKLEWPEYWPDEVIKIARWSGGRHYYLSSNKNRIFSPEKYIRHDDALAVAKQYTENIESKC